MSKTEIWLDIEGFEGVYQVSNLGRIKRIADSRTSKSGKIMKATRSGRTGYYLIGLTKDKKQIRFSVHRLVAAAFLGRCPTGYQCNHRDGNRINNNVSNLEWVTPSENLKHSFRVLGRQPTISPRYGEDHHNTKLKKSDIPNIRKMLKEKVSLREIGRRYGVHWSTIRNIRDNEAWVQIK